VRSEAKEHGLGNQIEGYFEPGQKVVVIEDLISTGGSSLGAVRALREAGCEVLGMIAIFTYEFKKATDGFAAGNVELHTLSNYSTLIETAVKSGYISIRGGDTERVENGPFEWRGMKLDRSAPVTVARPAEAGPVSATW
jgi:orotate phosphoribosyltransferase